MNPPTSEIASQLITLLAALMLVTQLLLAVQQMLVTNIRIFALQSLLLAAIAAVVGYVYGAWHVYVIAVLTIMVVRYGLLVTAVAFAVGSLLEDIPLTLSLSHWTATTSNLTLATALAVTFFGFYAARAGQPLFGKIGDMGEDR